MSQILRLSDAGARRPIPFDLAPGPEARAALAAALDLLALRKLRFAGTIRPDGAADWVLEAQLGATAVQPCVVTLAPVTTRIDQPVVRRYLAEFEIPSESGEVEMPDDDTAEPLPAAVDLTEVLAEALALALPDFPRAEGVSLGDAVYAAPGVAPMRDEDARPFASLAEFRDKLSRDS
ncbi:DUF177 domain-containing protein [Rhodobacteraceae bacterium CCMM004]|nr:DUF177 domain-containing protein [Rhodobacteraceae bacterium CCMM004]